MFKCHHLLIKILVILGCLLWSPVQADDLVRPDPSIGPDEVVAIQLMGLKNNDIVETDFGIRQAWNFAHPRNRMTTGPFPKFLMMIKGPGYSALLNHKSHKIRTAKDLSKDKTDNGEMWRQFDVLMETVNGDILYFSWVVQKVVSGQFHDCWMTVSVSSPRPAGQSG